MFLDSVWYFEYYFLRILISRPGASVREDAGNETEMLCECDSAAPEEDCAVDTWTDVLNGRQVPAQPLVFRRHFREVSFKVSSDFRQYG